MLLSDLSMMTIQIMLAKLSDQLRLRVQSGEKEKSIREKKLKQLKWGQLKEVVREGGYIVSGDQKKVKMKDGHGDDITPLFNRVLHK